MKAELIRIGNSRGVRIPKPLIEQCGLGDVVELRVENDRLVISPESTPRKGWGEAFRAAAEKTTTAPLGITGNNKFDRRDWKW